MNARSGKEYDALVAAYREGLGVVAIMPSREEGTVHAVAAQDIFESATERWWCRNAAEAERVVSAANRTTRGADTGASIPRAAKRLNVALRSDRDIAEEAGVVIKRVTAEFELLRNNGGLRPVNKSYRDYRLETVARGERVMPYALWMRAYLENLVRRAAVTLRYL